MLLFINQNRVWMKEFKLASMVKILKNESYCVMQLAEVNYVYNV